MDVWVSSTRKHHLPEGGEMVTPVIALFVAGFLLLLHWIRKGMPLDRRNRELRAAIIWPFELAIIVGGLIQLGLSLSG
jgi:hypothetical protein